MIGIVAILVGILLPALSGARNTAKIASAQSQARDITSATNAFRAQESRAPGFFSETAMGNSDNLDAGFTQMENLLLDLAGGVVDPLADNFGGADGGPDGVPDNVIMPADENRFLEVGPYPDGDDRNVIVDIDGVGSSTGPGFLGIDSDTLFPVLGQATIVDEYNGSQIVKGMPDIIDPWGMPLLAWRRDPGASLNAPASSTGAGNFDYFTQIEYSQLDGRAGFYWNSNAGMLNSGSPTAAGQRGGDGLTDRLVDVYSRSMIGGQMATEGNDELVKSTMAAFLGSPGLPLPNQATDQAWRPAQARGEIIVMSAGVDGMYLQPQKTAQTSMSVSSLDADDQWIPYVPTGSSQQGSTASSLLESQDDIILGGG